MAISEEQVRHVALLARLALTDDQVDVLCRPAQRRSSSTSRRSRSSTWPSVPPTAHAVSVTNSIAATRSSPGLPQEQALLNAPKQRDGAFVIPRIVGRGG